jgi:hypothetical protein
MVHTSTQVAQQSSWGLQRTALEFNFMQVGTPTSSQAGACVIATYPRKPKVYYIKLQQRKPVDMELGLCRNRFDVCSEWGIAY